MLVQRTVFVLMAGLFCSLAPVGLPSVSGKEEQPTICGTWRGVESAQDTNDLKLIFRNDGTVIAVDEKHTWKGAWEMDAEGKVMIELQFPNRVYYVGTLQGNRISGVAARPEGKGSWTWTVCR